MAEICALSVRDYCFEERRKENTLKILEEAVATSETGLSLEVGEILDADKEQVKKYLLGCEKEEKYHVVIVTGGIGVAPNDFMPELLLELCDKHLFAIGRLMWEAVSKLSPLSALTRPRAGIRGSTIMLALPGGPKAARVALESIIGLLPTAIRWSNGPDEECKSTDDWFDWV